MAVQNSNDPEALLPPTPCGRFEWAETKIGDSADRADLVKLVNATIDIAYGCATVFDLIRAHNCHDACGEMTYLSLYQLSRLERLAMVSLETLGSQADRIERRLAERREDQKH